MPVLYKHEWDITYLSSIAKEDAPIWKMSQLAHLQTIMSLPELL